MQWEYRLELIGGPAHSWRRESREVLDPLGLDGWEAVGVVQWTHGHAGEFLVLFKRPLGAAAGAEAADGG